MYKIPKGIQEFIIGGIVQKTEKMLFNKHLISEKEFKKEYAEIRKIVAWSKKNCSIYRELEAMSDVSLIIGHTKWGFLY